MCGCTLEEQGKPRLAAFPRNIPSRPLAPPALTAIEDRNNQLELHSRNNQKLLATLEALVGRLTLPDSAERVLSAREVAVGR